MGYKRPKQRLHRDFAYLAHDAVINSLSALEAGKVDEIIQKTSEASDRGIEAGVKAGPAKAGASRKRQAQMEYELVRTRTHFSAFEAWYQHLKEKDGIGTFDAWDAGVRDDIEVGDTIEFSGFVELSPVYLLFTNYTSFVDSVNKPGSVFKATGQELKEHKATAAMMNGWIRQPDGAREVLSYFSPGGVRSPRVVGSFNDNYLVGGLQAIEGDFTVIAQVVAKPEEGVRQSVMRVLSDVPPTPLELETMEEALKHFQGETAQGLGVDLNDDDLRLTYPDVIIRPLAVYK